MASSWATNTSYGSFFNFTSWMGLILSIFIFIAQSLEVYQRPAFRQYPWKAIELGYSGLWSFFYLVASCCIANLWHATAATIFGFFTCALYVGLVIYKIFFCPAVYYLIRRIYPTKLGGQARTQWTTFIQVGFWTGQNVILCYSLQSL